MPRERLCSGVAGRVPNGACQWRRAASKASCHVSGREEGSEGPGLSLPAVAVKSTGFGPGAPPRRLITSRISNCHDRLCRFIGQLAPHWLAARTPRARVAGYWITRWARQPSARNTALSGAADAAASVLLSLSHPFALAQFFFLFRNDSQRTSAASCIELLLPKAGR